MKNVYPSIDPAVKKAYLYGFHGHSDQNTLMICKVFVYERLLKVMILFLEQTPRTSSKGRMAGPVSVAQGIPSHGSAEPKYNSGFSTSRERSIQKVFPSGGKLTMTSSETTVSSDL